MSDLADGAALVELSNPAQVAAALLAAAPDGLFDAVPGARTLLLLFDPARFSPSSLPEPQALSFTPRLVRLRAVYDGPDLSDLGMPVADLVRLHTHAVHTVAFLGFAPGFAYLSGAPISPPRLKTPRVRVPAGSLAVADGYSGVYPTESPGGWRLIGRVAERMFDPSKSPPALLRPGDQVQFEPVSSLEPALPAPHLPSPQPVLRVLKPGPMTTIQGAPRYGLSSSGVPAGGAMDLPALAAANALVGNAAGAAALEYTLAGPLLEAIEPVVVAFDGAAVSLSPGDRLQVPALRDRLRGYLAVAGGLLEPLPGETVRGLRPELGLAREQRAFSVAPRVTRSQQNLVVRALAGPQFSSHFRSPEAFFAREWTLSPQSDRRGLRLSGEPLDLIRADIPPEGTAPGAVQVPGDGQPIVLGPDRPVTGGYAKIATVISADLPLLAQARPGTRLRFHQVTLQEALACRPV